MRLPVRTRQGDARKEMFDPEFLDKSCPAPQKTRKASPTTRPPAPAPTAFRTRNARSRGTRLALGRASRWEHPRLGAFAGRTQFLGEAPGAATRVVSARASRRHARLAGRTFTRAHLRAGAHPSRRGTPSRRSAPFAPRHASVICSGDHCLVTKQWSPARKRRSGDFAGPRCLVVHPRL